MLVPYSWLKDFINLRAPAEVVGERLSLATIGVEEVRKEGKEHILNLEVTYNRGDLLSVVGVARELAALYDLEFHGEEERFKPSADANKLLVKSDENLSRLYALTLIDSLSYQETPEKMKKRIELAGMRPINLFADITNYVMLEYGQPLHAFDAGKVRKRLPRGEGLSIEVRNAERGETIKTLDGSTHTLEASDIVIADRKGPIAIAGVMGGQDTEVDFGTKEILLEAAIFDPIAIRRTARRVGLRSEASTRFEHYLSPENLLKALNKALKLYQLYGSGKVEGFGQIGKAKTTPEPVNLNATKLNSLLGTEINIAEARQHLIRLGFKVMSSDKGLVAWPPYFRGDVICEEDLIEEIARLYGYENLPTTSPATTATDTPINNFEYLRNYLSELLAGMGFAEVKSYPFLSSEALVHWDREQLRKLKNPISAEAEYLKDCNLLNLLEIAQKNAPHYTKERLFELEKIYPKEGEYFALTAILWGVPEAYLTIKGVLETLLTKAHLNEYKFVPAKHGLLHPSKTAKITTDGTTVGIIGELHPHLAESYSLKDSALFEINLEELAKHAKRWGSYTPISKYPEVYEDFSFFLPYPAPSGTKFPSGARGSYKKQLGLLVKRIKNLDKPIKEVELIDLFDKRGRRSVTLRITFQSDTKELSSKDLKPVRNEVVKLIKGSGGKLRD